MIKILSRESAYVKVEIFLGTTILILAALQDSAIILDALLGSVIPGIENALLGDPLITAIKGGKNQIVEYLLSRGVPADSTDESTGRSLLPNAAQYGNGSMLEPLLQSDASLGKSDLNGYTPLSMTAAYVKWGAVKALWIKGAMTDTKDKQGRMPLHGMAIRSLSAS